MTISTKRRTRWRTARTAEGEQNACLSRDGLSVGFGVTAAWEPEPLDLYTTRTSDMGKVTGVWLLVADV